MKILIINWRSITDPLKGGAEVVTFEHARRWTSKHNAEITWICAKYDKNKDFEEFEGIKFLYLGNELRRDSIFSLLLSFPYFFFLVYQTYQNKFKGKVDVVIDQIHGIPFLTPLYVKEKVILYIHEVAGEIWNKMFPFPINSLGIFLERMLLKFYKKITVITGSNSTKKDLLDLGFNSKSIKIVEHGINLKPINKKTKKFTSFTILFLNRMVKMKGPERALEIFKKLKKEVPEAKLIMIGKGEKEYINELKEISKNLGINKDVEFLGFISEEEKISYLQNSHVLINTSFKEGWGLVNIEANTQGTPAVAFDVEGCRDSIKNGINGYISKDENDFVKNILKIRSIDLSESSIEFSRKFDWEIKSEDFYKEISK